MNALSLLRDSEILGAREFRHKLDRILRKPTGLCRVLVHSKPAVAVLPDAVFLQLLELLQELQNEGLLKRVIRKLESRRLHRHAWFWDPSWQKKEKEADEEIRAGKVRRAASAGEFLRQMQA